MKYSYETYADLRKEATTKKASQPRKVGYFKLKPGESAIVRFDYSTPAEFEIVTVHEVKVQDKFRTVACVRSVKDPVSMCPLCASGVPVKDRFYVKLLHYVEDASGNITVQPEVANWARKYADTLKARLNEYGDLKENLFKITRIGSGMETTYDITYANPVKYSAEKGYVKDFSAFEDFDLAHHSYTERSKEDIEEFLQTGEFPIPTKKEKEEPQVSLVMPESDEDLIHPFETKVVPTQTGTTTTTTTPATTTTDTTTVRPRRTYDWNN